jgi:hypothetical protein
VKVGTGPGASRLQTGAPAHPAETHGKLYTHINTGSRGEFRDVADSGDSTGLACSCFTQGWWTQFPAGSHAVRVRMAILSLGGS